MTSHRKGLKALKAIVEKSRAGTQQAREEVVARRQKKSTETTISRPEVPSFELSLTNPGQPSERPVTSTNVRRWFRDGLLKLYGADFALPSEDQWWTIAEMSLAKKLLKQYDPVLVEKAVSHFCATWNQRLDVADGALGGMPTIKLLYKIRVQVFGEAQGKVDFPKKKKASASRNKRDVGEYKKGKPVGFGWEK